MQELLSATIVSPLFNSSSQQHALLHHEIIRSLLKNAFEGVLKERSLCELFHSVPLATIFSQNQSENFPERRETITFCALLKRRAGSLKFFQEMVCSWLIPDKTFNPQLVYAVDFTLPQVSQEVYTIIEIKIEGERPEETQSIRSAFSAIHTDICLGLESSRFAHRIFESKGHSTDVTTSAVGKQIAYLINQRPEFFNQDLLHAMQLLLATCPEQFKLNRESRHLVRIICVHHFFRIALNQLVKDFPEKRHLCLKIFKARIRAKNTFKFVLCVSVGVNFLMGKELFDRAHLVKAIQNLIPTAHPIENSYFANRRGLEPIGTLYLEIEKPNEEAFNHSEIDLLRRELPSDLKNSIEHLMHPVFMPRNEEEIIRNILSLSSQIKYVRDIPQVFISFDEQTALHLYFIVVLVRVIKKESIPIQEMFKNANTLLEYIHDRTQNAGNLRRKYKKEATVFRVKLAKENYLRADHSIDLVRARQVLSEELSAVVGEIRDYNGGIISKQNELFSNLCKLLKGSVKYNDLLLENFFYSLTPVIMRSVLEPEVLRTLFLMLVESLEEGALREKNHALRFSIERQFVFVMIKTEDRALKDRLYWAVNQLQIHASKLAYSYVSVYDLIYLGTIYRCDDQIQQEAFCEIFRQALLYS